MVWPFNRKKNDANVPQEVQDYYQAQRRERVGVAWVLGISAFIITILLAAGVFYGGRWIYRSVFDKDNQPAQQETAESKDQQAAEQSPQQSTDEQSHEHQSGSTPTPGPTQPGSSATNSNLPRTGPDLDL